MATKNETFDLFAITPEMEHYASLCESHSTIDTSLYAKYDVKRGLRDINGKGGPHGPHGNFRNPVEQDGGRQVRPL